jgi:hypothetical protein
VTNDTFYVRHAPAVAHQTIEPEVLVAYAQFISEMIRQLVDEPLISFNLTNYAEQMDKLTVQYLAQFNGPYESLTAHIGHPSKIKEFPLEMQTTL